MEAEEIRAIILRELPQILQTDPEVRELVLRLARAEFANKAQTEGRFEQLLAQLQRDREEQTRKWEEESQRWQTQMQELRRLREESEQRWQAQAEELRQQREESERRWQAQEARWEEQRINWEEQNRRWEEQRALWAEQNRKWEEQNQRWEEQRALWAEQSRRWEEEDRRWEEQRALWAEQNQRWEEQNRKWWENQATINRLIRRVETGISAIGARWGIQAEASFRNGLAAILEESFGVRVFSVTEYDASGEVFGQPDQVELDVIVKDGQLIVCEIKSSMSRADMYTFDRKVRFYERLQGRTATRRMVISPMVEERARRIAEELGIEVYSYADDIPSL